MPSWFADVSGIVNIAAANGVSNEQLVDYQLGQRYSVDNSPFIYEGFKWAPVHTCDCAFRALIDETRQERFDPIRHPGHHQ